MEYLPNNRSVKLFSFFSRLFAVTIFGIGLICFLGWIFGVKHFGFLPFGYGFIKFNSCIVSMLGGAVLYFVPCSKVPGRTRTVVQAALALIFGIGLLTFIQYLFKVDLGIDELFVKDIAEPTLGLYPGRLSVAASVTCMLIPLSIVLQLRGVHYIPQVVFILVGLIAYSRVLGDFLGLKFVETMSFYSLMELNTAVIVLVVALGFLTTFPDKGIMRILSSDYLGSKITRRIMPLALALSLLIIAARIYAVKYGLVKESEAIVLSVTVFTFLILVIFLVYGYLLNDLGHRQAKQELLAREKDIKLNGIIESGFAAVWIIDRDFNLVLFNKLFEEYYSQAMGRKPRKGDNVLQNTIDLKLTKLYRQYYERALKGEAFEAHIDHGVINDQLVSSKVFFSPVKHEDGQVIEVSMVSIDVSELRQKQQELENTLIRHHAVLENTNAIIWSVDKERRYTGFNQAFITWIKEQGFVASLGGKASALENVDINSDWANYYDRVINAGENLDIEYFPNKDEATCVRFLMKPIRKGEEIVGASGIGIDVTERYLQEKELEGKQKELEAAFSQLNAIIENTDAFICSVDNQARYIAANSKFKKLAGVFNSTVEMGAVALQTVSDPELRTDLQTCMFKALNGAASTYEFEREIMGRNIATKVFFSPIYLNEQIIGGTAIGLDMTESREQQLRIEKSKAQIDALIESSNAMVWAVDVNWNYIIINAKYKEFVTRNGGDISIGRKAFETIPDPALKAEAQSKMRAVFEGKKEEFIVEIPDDKEFKVVKFMVTPIYLRDQIIGATAIGLDLSHEREVQGQLQLAKEKAEEAAKAKSQFFSVMSHEIRTPLNAVIGISNLLMKEELKTAQMDKVRTLKFSGEHLLGIVNDILDFNKIEEGMLVLEEIAFCPEDYIQAIVESFQHKATEQGIAIKADLRACEGDMVGDPLRFSQIMNNLISNAIKFTHQGAIMVSTERIAATPDTIITRFKVSDTGIGIPADRIQTIFDPFIQAGEDTTRKYGGTGLGLSICNRLLTIMGSTLHVESEVGKGSTFWFDMEFKKAEEGVKPVSYVNAGMIEEGNLQEKLVLVVDDNPINRMVAEEFLIGWNARVDYAENGIEAVSKVKDLPIDLVLMDLQMPEMDGYEATRAIRALSDGKAQLPIIALTASPIQEVKQQVLENGMNDWISKPFEPSEFYKKVVQHLFSSQRA